MIHILEDNTLYINFFVKKKFLFGTWIWASRANHQASL